MKTSMATPRGLGIGAGLEAGLARDLAARCDDLGYHSLWANDEPAASGLETLAHFAAAAPQLDLGVGVLPLDRHQPARIAAEVDRGTQAHYDTEEAVESRGAQPRDAGRGDPPFDLAWTIDGEVWIAEVKSLTATNEEQQLRYGLGQLLRYGHHFAALNPKLVLAVERAVSEPAWVSTCTSVDVVLTWPTSFDDGLVVST